MQASELISNSILPLHPKNKGSEALQLMSQFRVDHLPISKNSIYLGLISEKEINEWESNNDLLSEHLPNIASPYVLSDQHLFDIIKVLDKNNLSIIIMLVKNMCKICKK